MIKRIIQTLKSKSGASMMFVLGIMMLLMFIGTSVLVAASAAVGAGINRQVSSQLELYADSIQRTVWHSLRAIEDEVGEDVSDLFNVDITSLGGKLVRVMYMAASALDDGDITSFIFSSNEIAGDTANTILANDIPVGFTFQDGYSATVSIMIEPGIQMTRIDEETVSYMVSARATVTVEVIGPRNRALTSVVIYRYLDGHIIGNPAGAMLIDDAGDWGFISHEKVERRTED